jgi:hypothetical protein
MKDQLPSSAAEHAKEQNMRTNTATARAREEERAMILGLLLYLNYYRTACDLLL